MEAGNIYVVSVDHDLPFGIGGGCGETTYFVEALLRNWLGLVARITSCCVVIYIARGVIVIDTPVRLPLI